MAGGTFTTQTKTRPGAYINVKTNGGVNTAESTTGTVTLPMVMSFGPEKEVIKINATSDLTALGYDLGHKNLLLLREALKQAKEVLLYRVGGGVKAAVTEGDLTVTALYGGSRGNDINVVVKPNVNAPEAFDVETFIAGRLVDVQTVKAIEELKANRVVEFAGAGELTEISATLAGGSDTKPTVQEYMEYFGAVQTLEFNTMALPVEDEAIKTAAVAFAKRLRDEEGKKCQVVIADYAADHEAIINVKNGVILADGTKVSAAEATAWVAGASAAAGVSKSLTYTKYEGAVDVTQRFLNSEIVTSLQNGEFVFVEKRGEVVVEQDINSLHTFDSEKGRDFAKNRVLRVLDDIANNTKKAFEDHFIGKVNNDQDGRELFKADRIAYFSALQAQGAITDFAAEDIVVLPGEAKDTIYVEVNVQPVDAMEKLYMLVTVQ